ncbi:serine hydrolase [Streptomyces sp. NPDC097617]|uniref:D-alanyl-D-alanine carboxypeptidase n=1 Tax=Streptomyces sp. NPDC097617 TaxID=3366091 RepID=UPI00382A1C7F
MKAVTVAGGSSDDPEIKTETTVQKTDPEKAPTEPRDAVAPPEADAEADSGDEAAPEAGTEARSKAETGAEDAAEAGPEAGDGAEDEPVTEAEDTREPQAEAGEAKPELEDEPRADTKEKPLEGRNDAAVPEVEPARETEAEPSGEDEPEGEEPSHAEREPAKAAPGAEPEAELRSEAGSDADKRPASEAEADAGPEAELPVGAGADAENEAKAKGDTKTDPRLGTTDPRRPEAELRGGEPTDAKDEAKAAVRPGGKNEATAKDDAKGEDRTASHGGGGARSDETQVLGRPVVGPPKGPSWARKPEPDAERTSQFVALKDLNTPAPPAAAAATVAAPPAAPAGPLDLLADLTNTPAPPETPRRTAVRRVKIWTPILLLLVGAGAGAQLLRPLPAPQLVASATDRTLDGQFSVPWPAKGQGAVRVSGSGDVGTFGEQKPVPTASVAKVMTAYVLLKDHPLRKTEPGPDITIDAKAVADGTSEHESRISGLTAGTKFSQQDMLKMLMIPSGNNVARLLARWDSGTDSEAAFVAKMNAAAKELGMNNTTYTDPSGLDAGTVSTAADQLKLAEAVMKDETFRSIVALPNATIKGLPQRLENNNTLLTAQGLSIRGIKTGSSTPAGGTLVWAAYKSIGDETPLIVGALMDQRVDGPDEDAGNSLKLVLANSKTIIEAVRTALASIPVIRKGDVVGHVNDGLGGRTPLVATKDLNVIGVPGQQLKLSLAVGGGSGAGPLPHTAKAGAEVAVLTVGSGEGAKSVPVAVKGALAEPSFGTRLTRGR